MRAAMKLQNDLHLEPAQLSARLFCRSRRPAGVAVFRSPCGVAAPGKSATGKDLSAGRVCAHQAGRQNHDHG